MQLLILAFPMQVAYNSKPAAFLNSCVRLIMDYTSAGVSTHPCFFTSLTMVTIDSKIADFPYTCQVKIPTLPSYNA